MAMELDLAAEFITKVVEPIPDSGEIIEVHPSDENAACDKPAHVKIIYNVIRDHKTIVYILEIPVSHYLYIPDVISSEIHEFIKYCRKY